MEELVRLYRSEGGPVYMPKLALLEVKGHSLSLQLLLSTRLAEPLTALTLTLVTPTRTRMTLVTVTLTVLCSVPLKRVTWISAESVCVAW